MNSAGPEKEVGNHAENHGSYDKKAYCWLIREYFAVRIARVAHLYMSLKFKGGAENDRAKSLFKYSKHTRGLTFYGLVFVHLKYKHRNFA